MYRLCIQIYTYAHNIYIYILRGRLQHFDKLFRSERLLPPGIGKAAAPPAAGKGLSGLKGPGPAPTGGKGHGPPPSGRGPGSTGSKRQVTDKVEDGI